MAPALKARHPRLWDKEALFSQAILLSSGQMRIFPQGLKITGDMPNKTIAVNC